MSKYEVVFEVSVFVDCHGDEGVTNAVDKARARFEADARLYAQAAQVNDVALWIRGGAK